MKRKLVFALVIIFVILGILGTRIFFSAKKAFSTTKQAVGAAKLQNLDATKAYLKDARGEFSKIRTSNIVFSPLRYIPFVGWYIADFQRGINTAVYALDASITLADAMSPYADVLGLKGEGTFLGGTAKERLAKAIETLSIITPQIDQVGKDLALAKDEIDQVQTWRYPNFLPGKPAQIIKNAKDTIDQLETFVVDTKPLIEVLPEMMGQNSEKKYLILFQNDKELRPTGGFITAYAFFRLNNGVIASEGSQDIYQLDDSLLKKIQI